MPIAGVSAFNGADNTHDFPNNVLCFCSSQKESDFQMTRAGNVLKLLHNVSRWTGSPGDRTKYGYGGLMMTCVG